MSIRLISGIFWFKEFGFPYFYIRGEFLLSLNFWNIRLFLPFLTFELLLKFKRASQIMASSGKSPYAPDYASYNWIGAPANYDLSTNADLGGDSRMSLS